MLAIPVPFVVALALALLFAVLSRRDGRPPSWPLTAFLLAAILQSSLVGLRWSTDFAAVRLVLPVTATFLPILAWATVAALRRTRRGIMIQMLPAAATVAVVALLATLWRRPIDLTLVAIEAGYGVAILRMAKAGPDGLDLARLGDATAVRPVIDALGRFLIASAAVDGILAIDFEFFGGTAAAAIVSVADLVVLAAVVGLTVLVGGSRPMADPQEPPRHGQSPREATAHRGMAVNRDDQQPGDAAVLATIDALMADRMIYRDPDLTLDRLARRAGLSSRTISGAVNRTHRLNVSQYVNGFRIAEAQRLLRTSDRPITAVMLDVGFQTKSNFNREFKRVVDCSPTEWRLRAEPRRQPLDIR